MNRQGAQLFTVEEFRFEYKGSVNVTIFDLKIIIIIKKNRVYIYFEKYINFFHWLYVLFSGEVT